MKKYFKNFIKYLFYNYCFTDSDLANDILCYHVPATMKKFHGLGIDGKFFYARLNYKCYANLNERDFYIPFLDISTTDLKDYTIYDARQENN